MCSTVNLGSPRSSCRVAKLSRCKRWDPDTGLYFKEDFMAFLLNPRGFARFTASGTLTHPAPGKAVRFFIRAIAGGGAGAGNNGSSSVYAGADGGDTTVTDGTTTITALGGRGGEQATNKLRASGVRNWWPYYTTANAEKHINGGSFQGIPSYTLWLPSIHPYGQGGFVSVALPGYTLYTPTSCGEHGEEKTGIIIATGNLTVTIGAGGIASASASNKGENGKPGIVIIEW
jgi:hypothetical protein